MSNIAYIVFAIMIALTMYACKANNEVKSEIETVQMKKSAKEILSNKAYRAISYGGYRQGSRMEQPTVEEVKNDMRILSAMGIKLLRTYNVHLQHATTVLEAIDQLQKENPNFEMYVMLGAWIDCKDAWTHHPNHYDENLEANELEISRAVALTKKYPQIVKIIAVGNEAMVKWAESYYVQPWVILKYVNHLQELKSKGELREDLWITSSDNFASWGGGDVMYHNEDLEKLAKAVDFISLHTYPMHDTHYNPVFWGVDAAMESLSKEKQISAAMKDALGYAQEQYRSTEKYLRSIGVESPIHIGETGWASHSNGHYGHDGSRATDEYKEGIYHKLMRQWTEKEGITCFYFEAFDEIWKDAENPGGSENHFGLITLDGKAKYALWDEVDRGVFDGLTRNGQPITKTYDGNRAALLKQVALPPIKSAVLQN